MNKSQRMFGRAEQIMPGGVNSPVRAFRAVGGTPRFIRAARGGVLHDVDGHPYVDLIGSWGAMIAGHAHPQVTEALERTLRDGTSFGTPSPLEVELAEQIIRCVPSVEKVRMTNSGTEAVMGAVRLARADTGRSRIVKFAGCYHGHADALLVRAGSGAATLGLPDSPGVPPEATRDTVLAAYNDASSVEMLFRQHGDTIAAVLVEPVAGNMGVVPPAPGFLEALRELTARNGALLVFDEVMTGFRVAPGGAQQRYRVRPDLTTFGKIIGGGLPVGALGGRAELMNRIAPQGPVYQAGTLSGNPLAMAAGLATLRLLDEAAYAQLERRAAILADGLHSALDRSGVEGVVQRVGSMLSVFFSRKSVRDFADAQSADHGRFAKFFHGMLDGGVHLPPSGYESWFVSLAHTEAQIQTVLDRAESVLRTI